MTTTYTNAITSNQDIDNEPEFIVTDEIAEIRRKRVRAQRIKKQQNTACSIASLITFIAFFGIFMASLMILAKIHPETIYTFLIWTMIIGFVELCAGAAVAGYLHECILRNWKM